MATFVIRDPEEVEAADDGRELTSLALYAPLLCLFNLLGLLFSSQWNKDVTEDDTRPHEPVSKDDADRASSPLNETTPLVAGSTERRQRRKSSIVELQQAFSMENEVAHRSSVVIMGLTCHDTKDEDSHRQSLRQELEELQKSSMEQEEDVEK